MDTAAVFLPAAGEGVCEWAEPGLFSCGSDAETGDFFECRVAFCGQSVPPRDGGDIFGVRGTGEVHAPFNRTDISPESSTPTLGLEFRGKCVTVASETLSSETAQFAVPSGRVGMATGNLDGVVGAGASGKLLLLLLKFGPAIAICVPTP